MPCGSVCAWRCTKCSNCAAILDRCVETFTIDRFRELMSVKPDVYPTALISSGLWLTRAVLEVNGLSDIGVQIDLQRKHTRAPFHAVTVAWWQKSPEEMARVARERNRSKVGRMARLKGAVETAEVALPSDQVGA